MEFYKNSTRLTWCNQFMCPSSHMLPPLGCTLFTVHCVHCSAIHPALYSCTHMVPLLGCPVCGSEGLWGSKEPTAYSSHCHGAHLEGNILGHILGVVERTYYWDFLAVVTMFTTIAIITISLQGKKLPTRLEACDCHDCHSCPTRLVQIPDCPRHSNQSNFNQSNQNSVQSW